MVEFDCQFRSVPDEGRKSFANDKDTQDKGDGLKGTVPCGLSPVKREKFLDNGDKKGKGDAPKGTSRYSPLPTLHKENGDTAKAMSPNWSQKILSYSLFTPVLMAVSFTALATASATLSSNGDGIT